MRGRRGGDSQGKISATHPGWLILEDRDKGLWFKQPRPPSVLRMDARGGNAMLALPNLLRDANFAESPDGSVWTLTNAELIRVRATGDRLSIVERYPVSVGQQDQEYCGRDGRVWVSHLAFGDRAPYWELIQFATAP